MWMEGMIIRTVQNRLRQGCRLSVAGGRISRRGPDRTAHQRPRLGRRDR